MTTVPSARESTFTRIFFLFFANAVLVAKYVRGYGRIILMGTKVLVKYADICGYLSNSALISTILHNNKTNAHARIPAWIFRGYQRIYADKADWERRLFHGGAQNHQ